MSRYVYVPDHPKGSLVVDRFNRRYRFTSSIPSEAKVRRGYPFLLASYEVTDRCNYRCKHCYLDTIYSVLPFEEQKCVIDKIAEAGCLWLQLTGGEPLLSPDFCDLYSYAWEKGFLITIMTNGSLLGKKKYQDLFKEMPPYTISTSMYGASAPSYDKMVSRKGAYGKYINALEKSVKNDIPIRIKIIKTSINEEEESSMISLASKYGAYHVYEGMLPTISGSSNPISFQANRRNPDKKRSKHLCKAGQLFFHVCANGNVCLCKMCRSPSTSIFDEGVFTWLKQISPSLIKVPICDVSCDANNCVLCGPMFRLHVKANTLPHFMKGDEPCLKKCKMQVKYKKEEMKRT
jgi:MoaA/NifB/PqqE/SkfB family radical SAM enzyme